MSDCSTNANGPYDVARLRIEFEGDEIPWMYPLALNGRSIQGVFVDGERYERVVRCRDCKHYKKLPDDKGVCHPLGIVFADMDDCFCAWGESAPRGRNFEIDEPDTIRNELADGGLIADALAPVCVDEKERMAFERGRVHERFAQQIFKEATS